MNQLTKLPNTTKTDIIEQLNENSVVVREQIKRIFKHKNEGDREIAGIVIVHMISVFGNITVDAYESDFYYEYIVPAIKKRKDFAKCFESFFFKTQGHRNYRSFWNEVKKWYEM